MTAPSSFAIRGRRLLPIVQGGMGVGISAHRLVGAVARAGAMGTIASIDLRHHHADLSEQAKHCRDKDVLNRLNLIALDREIKTALNIAAGHGLVAVNVMKAVDEYPAIVRQACASGAQAIVMGAGLPLDLPELVEGYPEVALIPILSDARGVAIVLKKWARKGRLPDAIVIEHPLYAGGHLGAPNPSELGHARFDVAEVLPGIFKLFDDLGIARGQIPVIVGGGINSHEKLLAALALGAAAVQLGTPFAVTEEGDAHPNFKRVLAEAKPEDIVTFMSVAGLARACGKNAVARQLPQARNQIAGGGQGRPQALRHWPALPDAMRPARWPRKSRPVLHRFTTGGGVEGRRQQRAVLSRFGAAAFRQRNPTGAGPDRLSADRREA